MTNSYLKKVISKVEGLARAGRQEEAMNLASEMIERHPESMDVWSLRAYLHGRSGNYSEAIADLTRAIEINPLEPHLFYDRGLKHLAQNDFEAAVLDFGKGLNLCEYYNSDYYREPLHFLRAEAFCKLGKKHEALRDLERVQTTFTSWTYKLRTKAELLEECNRLPD